MKKETDLASKTFIFKKWKKWDEKQRPTPKKKERKKKKKILSFIFSCALLSILDFFTLEDGSDRLSWNISMQWPLFVA